MQKRKILLSVTATVLLGFSSGLLTVSEINTWYAHLAKPSWNPPNWLFAPVWTTLYIMMGISFGIVWGSEMSGKKTAIWLFIIQFLLNLSWSLIFFRQHLIGVALMEIWFLFVFIVLTIINFSRLNKTAALLLFPYLLWVLFASILNTAIWMLNK